LNSQDRSGDVLFHALSLPFGWAKLPLLDLLEVRVRRASNPFMMPPTSITARHGTACTVAALDAGG